MRSASHFYQVGQVEPSEDPNLVIIFVICVLIYMLFIFAYKIYKKMKRRERD